MPIILKIMQKELFRWGNMRRFYGISGIFFLCVGTYTWFFNGYSPFFDTHRIIPANLLALFWGMALFIPLLATGAILEERKTQTIHILLAKPVSITQFVLGKLAAIKIVIIGFFLLTLSYYVGISELDKFTLSYLFPNFIFLLFMGLSYAAISMAVACFFRLYWKSYLVAYLCILPLHFVADFIGNWSSGEIQTIFSYIGIHKHFTYFLEGGFALSSMVYLTTLLLLGIFITIYKLSKDYL